MNPRRCLPLVLAGVLCLGFAPAPCFRPDRRGTPRADLAALQGTWERVRLVSGGREVAREDMGETLIVSNATATFQPSRGQGLRSRCSVLLGETNGRKRVDLRTLNEGGPSYHLLGLYRLSGDTLTICYSSARRPPDFDPTRRDVYLTVYARKKR